MPDTTLPTATVAEIDRYVLLFDGLFAMTGDWVARAPDDRHTLHVLVRAGRLAREPHRPLPIGAADAGRDPRAALPPRLPQLPAIELEHRLRGDRRRGRHPPRPDARLPDRGRRRLALLPARPRAGDRRLDRPAGARVAVGVRARARRRAAGRGRRGGAAAVMKNWMALVSGPAFAVDRVPGLWVSSFETSVANS